MRNSTSIQPPIPSPRSYRPGALALGACLALGAGTASATTGRHQLLATAADAQAFFGGKKAKLAFQYNPNDTTTEDGGWIYFLDFSENPLREHLVRKESVLWHSIQTSPDGQWLAYISGGSLKIVPMAENVADAQVRTVASGAKNCKWWVNPKDGRLYLTWMADGTDKKPTPVTWFNWDKGSYDPATPGDLNDKYILIQTLDANMNPVGKADTLSTDGAPNSGLSPDGGFMSNEDTDTPAMTAGYTFGPCADMRAAIPTLFSRAANVVLCDAPVVTWIPAARETSVFGADGPLGNTAKGHGGYVVHTDFDKRRVTIDKWIWFGGGYCHGSINPAKDPSSYFYGSILHMLSGHGAFAVQKLDPGNRPSVMMDDQYGNKYPMVYKEETDDTLAMLKTPCIDDHCYRTYWHFPSWSWNENYASTGQDYNKSTSMIMYGYVVNFSKDLPHGKFLKVCQNGFYSPHLWVENDLYHDGNKNPVRLAARAGAPAGGFSVSALGERAILVTGLAEGPARVSARDASGRQVDLVPGTRPGGYLLPAGARGLLFLEVEQAARRQAFRWLARP